MATIGELDVTVSYKGAEKIYLRLDVRDGKKVIVDQHGREVAGLQHVRYQFGSEEMDTMCIEVAAHDEKGNIAIRGGN